MGRLVQIGSEPRLVLAVGVAWIPPTLLCRGISFLFILPDPQEQDT